MTNTFITHLLDGSFNVREEFYAFQAKMSTQQWHAHYSRRPLAFLPRRARGEAPSTERGCDPPEALTQSGIVTRH